MSDRQIVHELVTLVRVSTWLTEASGHTTNPVFLLINLASLAKPDIHCEHLVLIYSSTSIKSMIKSIHHVRYYVFIVHALLRYCNKSVSEFLGVWLFASVLFLINRAPFITGGVLFDVHVPALIVAIQPRAASTHVSRSVLWCVVSVEIFRIQGKLVSISFEFICLVAVYDLIREVIMIYITSIVSLWDIIHSCV